VDPSKSKITVPPRPTVTVAGSNRSSRATTCAPSSGGGGGGGGLGLGDAEGLGLGDAEGLGLGDAEGLGLGDAEGLGLGDANATGCQLGFRSSAALDARVVTLPLLGSTIRICRLVVPPASTATAMREPSGDHDGVYTGCSVGS
jgi:hypothetical protein